MLSGACLIGVLLMAWSMKLLKLDKYISYIVINSDCVVLKFFRFHKFNKCFDCTEYMQGSKHILS